MKLRVGQRLDLAWILVILLSTFAVAPLAYPGFFEAQTGFLPVFNATHLSDAPAWGRLAEPVQGEGKLPYLIAWPFLQLTGSGIAAIKWGYALAFLTGALGIYTWTRPWLGSKGGVLAATVYTYLPWHLGTVYMRGAYAEAWLWAFWPPILWAIDRLNRRQLGSTAVGLAIGLTFLVATFWTQPGLAALALPVLVAYASLGSSQRPWPLLHLAEVLGLLLLVLWVLVRRLPEARASFAEQYLAPFQLLSAGTHNGLSFQLGVAAMGLSIVAVALWMGRGNGERSSPSGIAATSERERPVYRLPRRTVWFWLVCLVLLVLLSLPLSAWLWQASGFEALLTYPWQVLVVTGLPLAFLSGLVIRLDDRLATLPAWAGLVALVILASSPYLSPSYTQADPGPEPIALLQPVEADAPQIVLLDYEVTPATEITPSLTVTLTWQAVEPVAGDYTVFVHLLTENDVKIAQVDRRPCEGECPTETWTPGQIIHDRYELALNRGGETDMAPGPRRLAVGLYLPDTGDRASVIGQEDRTVVLDVP
jgi:hypothetical protein